MINILKKYWLLFLTEIIIVIVFCVYYGCYGDIMIDSFREVYIPEQIINGKVLYKNIFCIYPPLGYLINALLYKLFGVNLSIIYFAGLFTTLGIFFFLYKICEMFFDKFTILGINLFFISGLVLSPNVFNPFLPYSSGIIYGLFFVMISLYLCLIKKLPLAYLFCSLAICSKAEYLLLLPALIYISRKESLGKNFALFFIPPVIITGILFIQGLRFEDLIISAEIINLIGKTNVLREFYFSMGLVPVIEHIPLYIVNFFKFLLPHGLSSYQPVLAWAFPIITILFIFRYKYLNKNEKFLIIASVLVSLKVYFALVLQSYGAYYLAFGVIAIGLLLGKISRKVFTILLIIWALVIGFNHSKILLQKNYVIKSEKGIVKTVSNTGKEISAIIDYANSIPENSKIIVYPECLAVNYFSGRKSDDKFYSLIPLYVETFGEENIINRLNINSPDYIIINSYNTFSYGYSTFGVDYAKNIMKYIDKNYKKVDYANVPQGVNIFQIEKK